MPKRAQHTLLAAVAALLLVAWQLSIALKAGVVYGDFHAFYCAGHAVLQGANPYTSAALHPCESTPQSFGLSYAPAGVVVPAPLPGYALMVFAPFAALPYVAACLAWFALTLSFIALSAGALSILLNRPAGIMLWTLAAGFAVTSVSTGELGALLMAALLCMAVALRRGAWTFAAIAGAVSMLVPHVGLPAMLAVFLFFPAARVPAVIAAAVLAALDVLCGGFHTALSYFVDVLSAHARSEIGSSMQYGMTWVLHGLHFPDPVAMTGGAISYAVMAALGIVAARALIAKTGDAAYAALIPPAFAVAGGTFIHYTQIMIAIPASLLLFEQSGPRARPVFAASFLLVAIPWLWLLGEPSLLLLYAALGGTLALLVLGCSPTVALRVALGAMFVGGIVLLAGNYFGPAYASHTAALAVPPGLAQSSWSRFVHSHWSSTGIAWWIAKAPTWIGLLLLALGCAYLLTKERLEQIPLHA